MPISAIDLDGEEIKVVTGLGNTQIQATFGVITAGPGAVPMAAKDIQELSIEIALVLNHNPGTSIKIKDIEDPLARQNAIMEERAGCPECTYTEMLEKDACASVQFNISLFDAGGSDLTKQSALQSNIANGRLFLKNDDGSTYTDPSNGKSIKLGGIIIMGTADVILKYGENPNTYWNNVDKSGKIIPNSDIVAWYSNDKITLNPKYFDKSAPNYTGFSKTNGTVAGSMAHEIMHHFSLIHPPGSYPKEGYMGESPQRTGGTSDEIKQVIDNTPNDPR
jgi:hypothetical protein